MAESVDDKPAHSPIGASSYYRWKACPGSVQLSKDIEQQESSYAKRGTEAHDVAAGILEHLFWQNGKPTVPLGFEAEDMEAVKIYTEFIKREAKLALCDVEKQHVLVEHKFDLTSIYPGLYGTGDCVLYDAEKKKLMVIDYKHGQGIPVEVENNLQLQYYGLGALISTNLPCSTVELIIVQPRCDHADGPIRRWEIDSIDILNFAADLAKDAAATEFPDAPLQPGGHCRFCPAAATKCPALHKKAQELAKLEFTPTKKYDAKKLSNALDFVSVMKAWIKNVEDFAYNEGLQGRVPPKYKLVQKRASRKWKLNDEKILESLSKIASDNEYYEKKILTPAKVEKLLSKDEKKLMNELVVKESSGLKLVHESENGVPAKLDAKKEFKKINQ